VAARRRRHEAHEEHENHERWLITYADMITLLMVLFIVLFSIGQTDLKKFEQLKNSLSAGFGQEEQGALDGGTGVLDNGANPSLGVEQLARAALAEKQAHQAAVEREQAALQAAREEIAAHLASVGLADSVRFRLEARGLVVTVVTDRVLFDLGSAALRPEGRSVLDGLAPVLTKLPNPVAVEGHTDNLPISGGRYPSNWELSAERATSVLRYLVAAHRLPAVRLSAAGYADQRPLAGENAEADRARNRRVEIVVLSVAGTERKETA
jgi:chemotaxis protein MotB